MNHGHHISHISTTTEKRELKIQELKQTIYRNQSTKRLKRTLEALHEKTAGVMNTGMSTDFKGSREQNMIEVNKEKTIIACILTLRKEK